MPAKFFWFLPDVLAGQPRVLAVRRVRMRWVGIAWKPTRSWTSIRG